MVSRIQTKEMFYQTTFRCDQAFESNDEEAMIDNIKEVSKFTDRETNVKYGDVLEIFEVGAIADSDDVFENTKADIEDVSEIIDDVKDQDEEALKMQPAVKEGGESNFPKQTILFQSLT